MSQPSGVYQLCFRVRCGYQKIDCFIRAPTWTLKGVLCTVTMVDKNPYKVGNWKTPRISNSLTFQIYFYRLIAWHHKWLPHFAWEAYCWFSHECNSKAAPKVQLRWINRAVVVIEVVIPRCGGWRKRVKKYEDEEQQTTQEGANYGKINDHYSISLYSPKVDLWCSTLKLHILESVAEFM